MFTHINTTRCRTINIPKSTFLRIKNISFDFITFFINSKIKD